ncbi:MAG TPA: hypothetical protein VEJ47_13895 [Candidatus Eremiobacteraceae bacterium]|nr:hypothetical protein [Candidatus Eremiobacteraceae bacterium]
MKTSRIFVALLGAALLLSASAFARAANKGSVKLQQKLTVEGKTLDPGNYKVEWEGTGPTVQVKLFRNNENVATFPAQLSQENSPSGQGGYGSIAEPDGTRALTAIYLGHQVLQIQPDAAQQSSAAK